MTRRYALTALTILASLSTGYVLGVTQGESRAKEGAFIQQVIWTAYSEGRQSIVLDAIDGKLQEQEIASNDP